MHEYYIFPMSCIGDMQEMDDNEKHMLIDGIMQFWEKGGISTKEYDSPVVRVALRHAIENVRIIKQEIEGKS